MKKVKAVSVCILAFALSACRTQSESTVSTKQDVKETEETWSYDESETVVASNKDESVNVKADAYGKPVEITVNTTLTGIESSDVIRDETDLTNIKNRNGDEQFEIIDNTIYWQNLGNDISYSGISDAELPVKVDVKYYLDDQEMKAEEIKGKSGKVKISFLYTNQTEYEDVHVPFVCMSALMLDTDKFKNIEVSHGEVSLMDETAVVLGYAFPSLKEDLDLEAYEDLADIDIPESVEVEADVTDFSLDFTETIISSGMFSDLAQEDLNDLASAGKDMKELSDTGDQLVEGADALSSGFDKIKEAFLSYLDGMDGIATGVTALSDGSDQLIRGTGSLAEYAKLLSDTLNSVSLDDASVNEMINAIETDLTNILSIAQTITALSDGCNALTASLSAVLDADTQLSEEEKQKILSDFQSSEAYTSFSSSLQGLQTQLSSALSDIQTKIEGIDVSKIDDIKKDFQQLQQLAKGVYEGIGTVQSGLGQLDNGLTQLEEGVNEAAANNDTIKEALNSYASGLDEFSSGISKLNREGLQKLSQKLGTDVSSLVSSIRTLKEADASYQTFTKLSDQQSGSVMFMIETEGIAD